MAVTGPDFVSLQVRDLERSAAFYERYLGLKRSDAGPPHAVVFGTKPIAFAVRHVVAGTDLDAVAQPGQGMALWLHAPDAQNIHDALAAAGTTIVSAPVDGPFGRTFTFADPDGYQVTSTTAAEPGVPVTGAAGTLSGLLTAAGRPSGSGRVRLARVALGFAQTARVPWAPTFPDPQLPRSHRCS